MNTGLVVTLSFSTAVEILAPLAVAFWIARRWHVPWKFFAYGAAVFAVFQLFTRIPAIQIAQVALAGTLSSSPWYKYGWLVLAALTAGLFEEGGRYLGYRFLWKAEGKTWARALMYGAGHGGLECFYVGALTLLSLVNVIAIFQIDPGTLPADQALLIYQAREQVAGTSWWLALLPAVERLMTLVVQISFSVLVLQTFTRGRGYWWWLAFAYHAGLDLVAVLLTDWLSKALPTETLALVIEAAILPFALLSLWIIWRLRPRGAEGAAPGAGVPQVEVPDGGAGGEQP